jgi:hypothetical protein
VPASERRASRPRGLPEAAGDLGSRALGYRAIVANETEFFEPSAAIEALGKPESSDVAMLATLARDASKTR